MQASLRKSKRAEGKGRLSNARDTVFLFPFPETVFLTVSWGLRSLWDTDG